MSFWNTSTGTALATFLISMVPVVELRGAIPFGIARGLSVHTAMMLSIVGNMIPVPFIILFIRRIFAWLRRVSTKLNALVEKLEARGRDKSEVIMKYAFWGLFVLVAIPLPGTGAWTGALAAAMMDMRLRKAIPSITLGVIAAAVLVVLITCGAGALL